MPQTKAKTPTLKPDQAAMQQALSNPIPLIMKNRDKMSRLPPEIQIKFSEALFRSYLQPRLLKQSPDMSPDDLEQVKQKFVGTLTGVQTPPLDVGNVQAKPGLVDKAIGMGSGLVGGVAGSLAHAGELVPGMKGGPLAQPLRNAENFFYEGGKQMGGEGPANLGAGIGHTIPALEAGAGVRSLMPNAGNAGTLAQRILGRTVRGVAEGAAFSTFKEGAGGDVKSNAITTGLIEAAFPILGHFLGKAKSAVSTGVAQATATPAAGAVQSAVTGAPSAVSGTVSKAPSTLSDLKDIVSSEKFNKPYSDLTASEKATLPQVMKEKLVQMKADKASAAKVTKDAKRLIAEQQAAAKVRPGAQVKSVTQKPIVGKANPKEVYSRILSEPPPGSGTGGGPGTATEGLPHQGISPIDHAAAEARAGRKLTSSEAENLDRRIRLEQAHNAGEGIDPIAEMRKPPSATVTKVHEGQGGVLPIEAKKNLRNEKAAERMTATRQAATRNAQMSSLEQIAKQHAGNYTPSSLSGMSSIDLEDALIESLGEIGGAPGSMRKMISKVKIDNKLDDEGYKDALIQWLAKVKGINLE